jgi:hypothetical protein
MHLSLIGQLPTPLNEGHLFPGSHSGWAEPRLLAENRQIASFDNNGRCTLPAASRVKRPATCCESGLSADNQSDTAARQATQSLGLPKAYVHRVYGSALQARKSPFSGVSREAVANFEAPMTKAVWEVWFD